MAVHVAIVLGTTGEFLGDVEMVKLGEWLIRNNLKAGNMVGGVVTVWPFWGD